MYLNRNFHLLDGNLRVKSLTRFKHKLNITVVLLSCGSFFKYESVFCVNGIFESNKLAVHFKLTLDMTFVVLNKYLNCAADKTIDGDHTASTDCNN